MYLLTVPYELRLTVVNSLAASAELSEDHHGHRNEEQCSITVTMHIFPVAESSPLESEHPTDVGW